MSGRMIKKTKKTATIINTNITKKREEGWDFKNGNESIKKPTKCL